MNRPSIAERLRQSGEEIETEFRDADSENISYDFFKNMTSLSMLALGGVLTLSEKVFTDEIETWQMFLCAGFFAASGVVALQCQADIVQIARRKKNPTMWLRAGHRLAPGLLGGGVGVFLFLLARAMA